MRRLAPSSLTVVLAALATLPAAATAPFPGVSWYEGAAGFQRTVEEARREERPLLVYFRTDWCGYCRQFERELLATEEVETFLRKIVRVTINPEAGPEEARLASAYGVQGFPTMLLHPPTLGKPRSVERMIVAEGRPRLMTPVEFVQTLARAAQS